MRILSLPTLRDHWIKRPDSEEPLKAWYAEALKATWTQPSEIKEQYRSASILKHRRVVFNIKGNDYRLVAALSYKQQIVFVKFIGTHFEYDKIDAEIVEPV